MKTQINDLIKVEYFILIININIVIFYAGICFWFKNLLPVLTLNFICSTFLITAGIWHKSFDFKFFLINSLLNVAFLFLLIWRLESYFESIILATTFSLVIEIFISVIIIYLTFFKIIPFLFEEHPINIEKYLKLHYYISL